MMNLKEQRKVFELGKKIYSSTILTFHGMDGFDVYNTSIPFLWHDKEYIFGRVERRTEWARSWVRLFENSGQNEYTLVKDTMIYPLEDPYICWIGGEFVLGGTHVRFRANQIDTYYGYFYRGSDINDLRYFTTGPDFMKDIRLVELADKRIGVFSRPRHPLIQAKYGSESQIGFTVINTLDELTAEIIENAPYIAGMFGEGEWGGCNQAYLLESGLIGVIGHKSYSEIDPKGLKQLVYLNVSFILDPSTREVSEQKIIGSRPCYPAYPPKRPDLVDVAFTSGIVLRQDGKVNLYSGIGDSTEGLIVIDNPFW